MASTCSYWSKSVNCPALTVDRNVHTGAFLTGFYSHLDHLQQYQTMLLPVKNGSCSFWPVNVTWCICSVLHVRFDSIRLLSAYSIHVHVVTFMYTCTLASIQVYEHFDWFLTLAVTEGSVVFNLYYVFFFNPYCRILDYFPYWYNPPFASCHLSVSFTCTYMYMVCLHVSEIKQKMPNLHVYFKERFRLKILHSKTVMQKKNLHSKINFV